MQWSRNTKTYLAVSFVILILGLAGQVIWASIRIEQVPRLSAPAVDRAGRVVIGLNSDLIVLDPTGAIVSRQRLPRAAHDAHDVIASDIAVDRHGHYLIADLGNTAIKKYDSRHRLLWSSGRDGSGRGEFWGSMRLAVHPHTDHVYATDTSGHRLHIFDAEGRHLKTLGRKGTMPGQFHFPNGVLFDSNGHLFVVNTNARRIDRLEASGQHLESMALIMGSATLCFSRWTQRRGGQLHRVQDRRKHRARLLTEKALRCRRPVRSGEEEVVDGGEALAVAWQIESSKLMVA